MMQEEYIITLHLNPQQMARFRTAFATVSGESEEELDEKLLLAAGQEVLRIALTKFCDEAAKQHQSLQLALTAM